MKRSLLVCAIAAVTAGNAYATDYNREVDLSNVNLVAGDKVISSTSGIHSNSNGNNRLNLGQGALVVQVENPDGYTEVGHGIKFDGDNLSHHLGTGTVIDVSNKGTGDVVGISIKNNNSNTSVTADKLNINVATVDGNGNAVLLEKSNLNLGSNSSINISIDSIGYYSESIAILAKNSNLKATDLTIGGNVDYGIKLTDASVADVGSNTKISGIDKSAVSVENGSKFTANTNLVIDVKGNSEFNNPVINLGIGENFVDLGDGAKIRTSTLGGIIILLDEKTKNDNNKFKAENLNIYSTGDSVQAVSVIKGEAVIDKGSINIASGSALSAVNHNSRESYIKFTNGSIVVASPENQGNNIPSYFAVGAEGSKSRIDLDNVTLSFRSSSDSYALSSKTGALIKANNISILGSEKATAANANNNSIIDFTGNTLIKVDSDQLALLATNMGEIKVKNRVDITGGIQATGGGIITLNTEAGIIRGNIEYTNNSEISWKGKNSVWRPTDDSYINNLELTDNSSVDFTGSDNYFKVNVDKLSGATEFKFKVDLNNALLADNLIVSNSSSGNHIVSVANQPSAKTNGTERLTIIKTPDGVANFTAMNEYEFGGYLYSLRRENNDPASHDFELYSTGEKSNGADASVSSTIIGNYLLNMAEQEHLTQRMSLLRADNLQYGSWVRTYGGKFKSFQSRQLKGFDMDYSGFQLGVDGQVMQTADAAWYLGSALHYTTSDQNYKAGSGKQKSYGATLYATYLTENNWYADLYLKYSHYKNKLDIRDSLGDKVKGNGTSNGLTASAEVGKRYQFNDSFYVEPNLKLSVGRISSSTIKNSNGLRVDLDKQNSVLARAGSNFGYSTVLAGQPVNLYTKLNYAHEFEAEQKYKLNGNKERLKFSGSWLEFGVGANTVINNNHSVFMEATGSTGNRFDKYDFNLGYKYSF
ncbi:autotransporter outer membrane beta-barrel domain-containing protein [Pseudomonas sp. F1_0610]|uniref:autotransporter outer membrane beta-barrel domain-containing protein n=1 Tax=Pseudomonas sp. F1_0610 TaxID=3114284 RepID=UPI0039C314F8